MIVILNFGGQFAHLIARRIRELGVASEILPFNSTIEEIKKLNPVGIIFSGGPSSVYEKDSPHPTKEVYDLKIPIFGICYGLQLLSFHHQGKVEATDSKEYGLKYVKVDSNSKLLANLSENEQVWMSHGDHVTQVPKSFKIIASTDTCPIAAFESEELQLYGVQFHAEVVHTPKGKTIFQNFLKICNAKENWNMKDLSKTLIEKLKKQIGDEQVLFGVSGGVDSTVASRILYEAIGDKLHCVFVDHGLLRHKEKEQVCDYFQNQLKMKNFTCVEAQENFLEKLKGITDPEEKRKIIGHTFIETFDHAVHNILKNSQIKWLGQGTIYPDRIESASPTKQASKIKSHHNLTLPEDMKLKIVEPINEFYKDEVRQLGRMMNVPEELINRHPFPGPGLAIRIVGEVNQEHLRIVRESDHILIESLKESNLYHSTWQAFTVLLPVKTVGVMGDKRTYEKLISIRAVNSVDGMTAEFTRFPFEFLEQVSNKIINKVKGVNRVVYDITSKPPGTIEYE